MHSHLHATEHASVGIGENDVARCAICDPSDLMKINGWNIFEYSSFSLIAILKFFNSEFSPSSLTGAATLCTLRGLERTSARRPKLRLFARACYDIRLGN